MLPPLDALGAAATTVQFIQFSAAIISTANEIRNAGTTVGLRELRKKSERLMGFNVGMRARRKLFAQNDEAISDLEKDLDAILKGCCAVADDLIGRLDKITKETRFMKGIVQAFRIYFAKDQLDQLSSQLDNYRGEINQCTLALMNEKLEKHHEDLATKIDRIENILEVVTFGGEHLMDFVNLKNTDLITSMEHDFLVEQRTILKAENEYADDAELALAIYGASILSATVTLNDSKGRKNQIHLTGTPSDVSKMDNAFLFRDGDGPPNDRIVSAEYKTVTGRILESIHYESRGTREEAISKAHEATFQWIFEDSSFKEFLQKPAHIFWVSGKPGSGKSTLMKYIYQRIETMEKEKVPPKMTVISFAFWNAGIPLQKNIEGLLRTILFEIFQNHPSMISIAFPDACRDVLVSKTFGLLNFSESKLRDGLIRLLEKYMMFKTSFNGNICLLIDGLDEYDGDASQLCELIDELSRYSCIKTIVSSRPWNVFLDAFSEMPSISLETLTRDDIWLYTKDNLEKACRKTNLKGPESIEDLVRQIVERASGVFLWVRLVIRSAATGIQNGDSIEDLQGIIERLPRDLEELFSRIFRRLDTAYAIESAKAFMVMQHHAGLNIGYLTLEQLFYAITGDLDSTIQMDQSPLTVDERLEVHKVMERKLFSRTGGLLEAYPVPSTDLGGSSAATIRVDFLHRTVRDFLYLKDIRDMIRDSTGPINPNVLLLKSCIHEIKTLTMQRATILASDRIMVDMKNTLLLVQMLEMQQKRPYTAALEALNISMTQHWTVAELCKSTESESEWWHASRYSCWSDFVARSLFREKLLISPIKASFETGDLESFFSLTLLSGCTLYVSDKTLVTKFSPKTSSLILWELVYQFWYPERDDPDEMQTERMFNRVTAIKQLLRQSVDFNSSLTFPPEDPCMSLIIPPFYGGDIEWNTVGKNLNVTLTIWEFFLIQTMQLCSAESDANVKPWFRSSERIIQILQICEEFLDHGSNTNVQPALQKDLEGYIKGPLADYRFSFRFSFEDVLQKLYRSSLDPKKAKFTPLDRTNTPDRLEDAFKATQEAYYRRLLSRKVYSKLQPYLKLVERIICSIFAQIFFAFVGGGVCVLLISRWL